MTRIYLDWNATTPLRPEARAAMAEAFDVIGNPSSVHAEGRAAKMLLERSREEIAEALGASRADIVFTSGSTEAASLALEGQGLACAGVYSIGRARGATPEMLRDNMAPSTQYTIFDPERIKILQMLTGLGMVGGAAAAGRPNEEMP